MEMSDNIADLSAALSKAQMIMEGAVKGKVNPAFKSRYADLASVWDACREPLASNGLSVIQMPGPVENGQMSLTTQINHSSGQWVRETMTIPLSKVDAQGYGSATSYARRYALAAFVGVSPDDDDGNAASKRAPAANDRSARKVVDDGQHAMLVSMIEKSGADVIKFLESYGAPSLSDFLAADFDDAVAKLTTKMRKAAA